MTPHIPAGKCRAHVPYAAGTACLCPKILKYCKILSGFAALEFWHPPCVDTKYSVPAEGGMPAIVLAGKLRAP